MSEKEPEVVEFKSGRPESVTIDTGDDSPNTVESSNIIPEVVTPLDNEPKEFEWKGVKFPGWCKNPHFVEIKGSAVMAIDNDAVTIEMKANWETRYRPILAALGKQVIEKALNIKIETL